MDIFKKREFLMQWSRQLLWSIEDSEYVNYIQSLPQDTITSQWLGCAGATENQIVEAEVRLGIILPPSYREFLKISNGWGKTTHFIDKLWSTEEIEWFSKRHQEDWIDPWLEGADFQTEQNLTDELLLSPFVPDEVYFIYGEEQDPVTMRDEYMQTALEISDTGDSAIYLLNPQIITSNGEWEAWFLASWLPGAKRYRSFWEMMEAEYQTFLSSLK